MAFYGGLSSGTTAVTSSDPRFLADGEHIVAPEWLTSTVTPASGQLVLTYFTSLKSESTGKIHVVTGATASSGLTLARVGLYSLDGSYNGTLVASSASSTTLGNATYTKTAVALSASYTRAAGTRYAIGFLFVGSTMPSLVATAGEYSVSAMPPRRVALLASQSDLPSSFTDTSLSQTSARPYAAVSA